MLCSHSPRNLTLMLTHLTMKMKMMEMTAIKRRSVHILCSFLDYLKLPAATAPACSTRSCVSTTTTTIISMGRFEILCCAHELIYLQETLTPRQAHLSRLRSSQTPPRKLLQHDDSSLSPVKLVNHTGLTIRQRSSHLLQSSSSQTP